MKANSLVVQSLSNDVQKMASQLEMTTLKYTISILDSQIKALPSVVGKLASLLYPVSNLVNLNAPVTVVTESISKTANEVQQIHTGENKDDPTNGGENLSRRILILGNIPT